MKQNRWLSILPLIIVILVLSSCATTPIAINQANAINTLLDNTYTPNGKNEITIVRDKGFFGGGCSILISVNSNKLAYLNAGEKVTFSLTPGQNLISAKKSSFCGGDYRSVSIDTNNDYVKIYDVGFGTNGDFYIQPYIKP